MEPDDEASADTSPQQRPLLPLPSAMTPEDGPDPPPAPLDWPAAAAAAMAAKHPPQVPPTTDVPTSSPLSSVPGSTYVVEVPSSQQQQQQVPTSPGGGSSSDVENFTGKIVYNPDGSAFLLDDSESDSEPERPPSRLATMVHVAASPALYSALYGHSPYLQHQQLQKAESTSSKVPEFPVVHSFRVFTLRDIDREDGEKVPTNTTAASTDGTTKFPSSSDYSSSATFPSSTAASPSAAGRCSSSLLESSSKPILMCFLCKLSFGFAKSFVSHAVGEHAIALNDEEKALMGVKGASAIIQGVGRDKTPTLSFLEPLSGPVAPTHSASHPPTTAVTTLVSSVASPVPCPKPPEQDLAPEMQDLMAIERLARAAVAASRAAQQQQNGDSRPSSRDSGATLRPASPPAAPCSCGGECPRCCDPLLPSRAAMSHSRNSCKTLKCPKCNWHYKYQETLEIHMKEKHPENELSCAYCLTNQSHPRLARGETYTCGYKPYRCEVCNYSTTTKGNLSIHMQSDKHINNVQELQNGGAMPPSATPPLGPTPPLVEPPSSAKKPPMPVGGPSPKPKATWRCDVCNYETNVARNLRIHMTSEKHNHNMMVLQQNVKHMQTLSAFQQMEPLFPFHPPGFLLPPPPPPPPPEGGQGQGQLQPEAALADMAYNHALLMMASQQQQQQHHEQHNQRAAAALALAAAQQAAVLSTKFSQQQQQEFEEPPVVVRPDVPFDERHGRLFQCCVCHVYSCDSVEALGAHCQMDRTRQREEEVLMIVAGTYICKLCTYKTNLKANFQLHCKTDKHLQRLQHVNHVKEGGPATEWKLQFCSTASSSVQVRCNACDHSTNSAHKLQLHAASPQHLQAARLFCWLANRQPAGGAECFFQCKGCGGFATKRKLAMIQHARSPRHARRCQGREDDEVIVVRELTGNENIIFDADVDTPMLDLSDDIKQEDTKPSPPPAASPSRLKKALEPKAEPTERCCCPFCPFSCGGEVQLQMHVVAQHSVPCPLCQEGCRGTEALEEHLIQVHNVIKEGVQRLLLMVDLATDASTTPKSTPKSSPSPTTTPKEEGTPPPAPSRTPQQQPPPEEAPEESKPVLSDEDLSCTFCNKGFSTPEELFSHQSEHGHMELRPTPTGLEYQCWWRKGQCDRTFRTPTAAQAHFKEAHLDCKTNTHQMMSSHDVKGNQQVAVSDRHVYRYRCNQCSLAFKTLEKLQLHSQYHLIRAATKCPLCGRSFRSVVALQKHVEATHADMSREQMERYQSSLATNPLLSGGGPLLGGVLDPSTTELLRKESARDVEDDLLMMGDAADESDQQQHQDVLEDYINSQSMAEDSYNDPNRKYKCHRCKVAFTRQSYLTSHNKTLLHRKGEKMSYPMEKYLDPNRPFKCDVCLESFTQKNILLVHYNSVSHLHKVKLSMKETTAAAPPRGSSPPAPSPPPSTPEEKKPFKCNICKVSYTQGSTLDIHVRSVLHQTRASKLHELAATGQIDLTAPLIERAPETPTTSEAIDSSSTTVPAENVPQTATPSSDHSVPTTSTSPAPSAPTSNNSTTPTSTLMTLPSLLSPAESLLLQQPEMTSQRPRCPFPRPRPLVYKRLVESFGFDVVMHFNENNHRRKKIKLEENVENNGEGQKSEEIAEQPDSTTSPDLPEINKSVCDLCSKEFSCIWVLKTHREEIHKEMVPFDFLLKFTETYRVLYDKQSADSSAALVVSPDDLDPPSTPGSEISPTPSSVASSNQPIPTPPTVVPQQPAESAASVTANQMAQLQFNQLLMSMGLGLGGPMGVNFMPPPLIPVLLPPPMDHPLMAFNHPAAMMGDPGSYFAAAAAAAAAQQQQQQKLLQQQQSAAAQQQKRARTRINDEQLKILRAYFDINNSPSEEQLVEMSDKSGLPLKVIKHWFRNTLFKERQRNKDSPYNFNNPPSTFLNLEEYEKTGEAKVVPLLHNNSGGYADSTNQSEADPEDDTEDSTLLEHHHEVKVEKTEHSSAKAKAHHQPKDEPLFNHHIRSESSSPPSSTNLNFGSPTSDSSQRGGTSFASPSHSMPQVVTTSNSTVTTSNGNVANTSSPSLMFPLSLATGNSPSYGVASGSTASSTSPSYAVSMATNSPSFGVGGNNNPSPSLGGNNNPANLSVNTSSYGMPSGGVGGTSCNQSSYSNNNPSPSSYGNPSASSPSYGMGGANNSPSYVSSSPSPYSGGNQSSYPGGGASGSSSGGKRANRTRFTDYQIKVLQEFFESNAYPKDDDLEYLSKLLSLSPRVIVVWFQNARQKARKVYENRPPTDVTDHATDDDNSKASSATGNLNYQCKKCLQSFQRYYELIKHQKNACFKDENPLAAMQLNTSSSSKPPPEDNKNANGTYRCDKCSLSFSRFDQWREHQIVHIMNPGIFPSQQHFAANSSFGILQFEAQQPPTPPLAATPTTLATPPLKRKAGEEEELQKAMGVMNDDSSQPKDKRLRTTILPEQLDYLYQKYQVESNPSRKMLENIAREVGLKKRVVQVWFQNTRARERKGQFRAHQQVIHKRCPFCRALFKARSALESHLATRHADQYTRGDINIDSLPDGEMDSNPETPTSSSEDCKSLYTGLAALGSQGSMGTTSQPDLNTMKKYYEDSLKKYLDDLSFLPSTPKEESTKQLNSSGPLDLSKPQPPPRVPSLDEKSNHSLQDDAKSETYSESTMDLTDEGMISSDPASPSGSSHHPHGQQGMGGAKRFRTQMSTVQLKVMKSVFADYKTPSMAECETLGREIGLPKRVVQVWFQNARAKEKKARLAFLKAFGHEMDPPKPPEECSVCKVKYNAKFSSTSMQDHLFSRRHLDALKAHITKMKKLTEGQQQHEQDASEEDPPSLMQQLHLMGLPPTPAPQKEQQQQPQEDKEPQRKEDNTKEDSIAPAPPPTTSEANNHLFPYMYGFPGYYAGLSGAFFHPGIFPGSQSGGANNNGPTTPSAPPTQPPGGGGGMFYDPSLYSTPLSLLQLPPTALPEVTRQLQQTSGDATARFSQDGKMLSDLVGVVSSADLSHATESEVDIGTVCKKCHLCFPSDDMCAAHQRASPCGGGVGTLRLVQVQLECRACRERMPTLLDFKFHCGGERHVKRVRALQQDAAAQNNNNNNSSSNGDAMMRQQQQNNLLMKMQQDKQANNNNALQRDAMNSYQKLQQQQNSKQQQQQQQQLCMNNGEAMSQSPNKLNNNNTVNGVEAMLQKQQQQQNTKNSEVGGRPSSASSTSSSHFAATPVVLAPPPMLLPQMGSDALLVGGGGGVRNSAHLFSTPDFRSELDAALRLGMEADSAHKAGMCFGGEATLSPETKRL